MEKVVVHCHFCGTPIPPERLEMSHGEDGRLRVAVKSVPGHPGLICGCPQAQALQAAFKKSLREEPS